MRCWFLRSICTGPVSLLDGHQVLRRQHLPAAVLTQHVVDVGHLLALDPRAAGRRSGTRCRARGTCAACVPATLVRIGVGDAGHREAEQRRLRRDRRAPPARAGLRRGRGARRRCPACRPSASLASCASRRAVGEILAADLEREPAAVVARRRTGSGSAAGCRPTALARMTTPGNARQLAAQLASRSVRSIASARPSASA